jgi:hypothetical protein
MKYAIMALLSIHGLIHAIGFAGAWGLTEFEGASQTPTNFVSAQPGEPIVRALGIVWLAALATFLAAAVLLGADSSAWRPAAAGAALISMIPVALWWANAPMGAVANALVIVAVVVAPKLSGVAA